LRRGILFPVLAGVVIAVSVALWPGSSSDPALDDISKLVEDVRSASYPQLQGVEITVHRMSSNDVYLESRFTIPSFFSQRLRYIILFNRQATARSIPPDGLRAIVAHELAHVDYFEKQSRMGLLALVQLLSVRYNARFERSADLETIQLGYGPGLKSFRAWVYRNIPPGSMEAKKRDYFSPEEIDAILAAERRDPQAIRAFLKCVPRDLTEIEARNTGANCPE
jgi:hypothetical protein